MVKDVVLLSSSEVVIGNMNFVQEEDGTLSLLDYLWNVLCFYTVEIDELIFDYFTSPTTVAGNVCCLKRELHGFHGGDTTNNCMKHCARDFFLELAVKYICFGT